MKIVLVEWGDAHATMAEELLEDADDFHKPFIQWSVGFVWKSNKDGISLVACRDEAGGRDRGLFIPRGMVRSVRVLGK
jgi:hypothetical protein